MRARHLILLAHLLHKVGIVGGDGLGRCAKMLSHVVDHLHRDSTISLHVQQQPWHFDLIETRSDALPPSSSHAMHA